MEEIFARTEALIGTSALEKIKDSCVAVFGLGGVGSFVAEALARAGVGSLCLIDGDVIEASKKAGCHDFISQLPNGYDTKVGEMGAKLSGGEKQRISIARMLLKDAPIIILDEALSALDIKNEKLITEMLEHIRKDKTVISIAHHLNTITQADQIVVIDKSEIVGCGTHTELLQSCSLYSDMVAAQNKVDTWNIR